MMKFVVALVLAMAAVACASLIPYRYGDGVNARHFYKGEVPYGIYGLGYNGYYGAYNYAPYYGYDGLGYGYGPYGYFGRYGTGYLGYGRYF
ncbi:shematrin-like protein 1 [Argiope bruennichi]|uniref:shematrin-like protein 1 n=1 Tax=Argiope bruennichi TaxID=94029 RepID=UPI0024945D25|nr:shematrin-like protein 1 [Argiope bruennichi]